MLAAVITIEKVKVNVSTALQVPTPVLWIVRVWPDEWIPRLPSLSPEYTGK
jgi:hypothetical protein